MFGRSVHRMGRGMVLVVLLGLASVATIVNATWVTRTFTGNGQASDEVETTVSGTHYIKVQAPAEGTFRVLFERIGMQFLEQFELSDGQCERRSRSLDQCDPACYAIGGTVSNYTSGTAQYWVSDPNHNLFSCPDTR